jgi:hypothetical protein
VGGGFARVYSACARRTASTCHGRGMRRRSNAESPVLYDGLTAERCLHAYSASQRIDYGHRLTPSQLAAARALWGQQLASRIAASAEAERLTVRVDDQSEP